MSRWCVVSGAVRRAPLLVYVSHNRSRTASRATRGVEQVSPVRLHQVGHGPQHVRLVRDRRNRCDAALYQVYVRTGLAFSGREGAGIGSATSPALLSSPAEYGNDQH